MSRVLPILFNTGMVQEILDGRKTATRRIAKGAKQSPYQPGDILYVRETWGWKPCWDCGMDAEEDYNGCYQEDAEKVYNKKKREWGCYCYKASMEDGEELYVDAWHPSIHMQKEAARIWLKVTNVRAERLQDIDDKGAYAEGAGEKYAIYQIGGRVCEFVKLWNSTVDKRKLDTYGWNANPWIWVIEFKRCEKPQSWENQT